MRNIQTKKSSKARLLFILLAVGLLTLIGLMAYSYFGDPALFDNESTSENEKRTEKKESSTTDSPISKKTKAPSISDDVDVTTPANDVPVAKKTTINITQLYQTNGRIDYQATISGTTGGTCSAIFESERGKPVTRTSKSTGNVCSASIPAMEFDAPGDWTLTLRYYIDNTQATATKNVKIR